jgi:RND family efflux transporter MFP subunit
MTQVMHQPRDIQAQLRSLSIPAEQRPASAAGRSRGTWIIGLLAVLGAGAVLFATRDRIISAARGLAGSSEVSAEIELITISAAAPPGPAPALTATGKIVSDHTVSVATKVSGQVVALYFEQGDYVAAGQILARIEDVLYRARRDEAAARLERSKAHREFQRLNFARVQRLVQVESAPSIEYADAKRAVEEAEAQVAADEATLVFAEKTLKDCEVVAPISGVILQRAVEVGDFVAAEGGLGANANARFAVIADMDKLRVEVDISELDIARLHKEMPCVIVPDAYKDRQYQGHIMWLDPGANYAKATVQVKVRIAEPDPFLRVEGSAQVTFLSEAPEQTADNASRSIWIPSSAVLSNSDGSSAVLAAKDGRLEKRPIAVGRRQGDRVEVTGGLIEGDRIAARDVDRLRAGQRIGS